MADLTPEQLKAQEANAKTAARVLELKSFAGKTFKLLGSDGPTRFVVLEYAGVGTPASGVPTHLFRVERFHPGAIFNPGATQFLDEHEIVEGDEPAAIKFQEVV